jgi:hypothetical protein
MTAAVVGLALGDDVLQLAAAVEDELAWTGAIPADDRLRGRAGGGRGRRRRVRGRRAPGPAPTAPGGRRSARRRTAWRGRWSTGWRARRSSSWPGSSRPRCARSSGGVGPIAGLAIAVPAELSGLARRVVRDAGLAAGAPAVRLVAAPSALVLALDGAAAVRALTLEVDRDALRVAVVELVDGVIDQLGYTVEVAVDDPAPADLVPAAVTAACERVLAAASLSTAALSDAVVVGSGVHAAAVAAHLAAWLGPVARSVPDPAGAVARGAARFARMFVAEPAAIAIDAVEPGWLLGAGSALAATVVRGAIAPTREVRLIARDQANRAAIDVELWEDSAPPRPYGRYHVTGLPPGAGAIAACEVTIDADLIPRIEASDMVNGGALAVAPVVEVGLHPDAVAALRAAVLEWEP